ncbi:MAG: glutamate ligase domain-containing protein [Oscillospiraceae bacterium]
MGVLADKDYPAMLAALDTQAAAYIAATPLSPRALPAAELGDYLKRFGKPVTVCADPAQAAELALAHAAPEDVICAVGSLYMAGAIRMDLRRDHNENSGH